ncbi:cytochrome P450 [Cadophora sp. MPI-SDFR-AT-0126]|nr:cytochrome P450 [Leotiomycetes sp. MPI-SDFR-AT-0126]
MNWSWKSPTWSYPAGELEWPEVRDPVVLGLLLFASIFVVYLFVLKPQRRSSLLVDGVRTPPGPPGYPLIGNLFDIPPTQSWLQLKAWADQYGPLYRLRLGRRDHVVISTEKIANDLLRERGNQYSSREQTVMAAELLSKHLRPLLLPYNDRWRRARKLMHRLTMPSSAASYEPAQSLEAKRLLYSLLRTPTAYERIFEQYSGGLIFRIGYGKAIITGEEKQLQRIINVNHNLERIASPGIYLVDTIPALKYLPALMAPFKREARRLHAEELSLFRELLNDVQVKVSEGRFEPCFAQIFLTERDKFPLTDDEGAYALGTLFEAGTGTTAAVMMSFCLAMTLYPEWQKPLWEEVDRVCGDRLPEFSDIPELPSVRAAIKEVLRWRPVTAGGVPHLLTQDDVYDGLFLKAGTVVHANQWAIHREPSLYPDPERFNPERWLRPEYPTYRAPLSRFPSLQNFSSFGFGRRICPGMNVAERSLFLLTARIMWACEFSKRKDNIGNDIEVPSYDYTSGFNTQPRPFQFDLKARSEKRQQLVDEAWRHAEATDPLRVPGSLI